jgi:hypothetical protein
MTYVLQEHRPGETVEVVVKRGGAEVTLFATLGTRGERSEPQSGAPTYPKAFGGVWGRRRAKRLRVLYEHAQSTNFVYSAKDSIFCE